MNIIVSDDILLERHNFISNNQEFKDKVLSCYNDIILDESQLDVYAEESIYKKFISNSDSFLMKEFQKLTGKINLLLWKNSKMKD